VVGFTWVVTDRPAFTSGFVWVVAARPALVLAVTEGLLLVVTGAVDLFVFTTGLAVVGADLGG
jgi:hypothetical protein